MRNGIVRYCRYSSPLGEIRIASDGTAVTGLWLPGQGGEEKIAAMGATLGDDEMLRMARTWLDRYFDGEEPDFMPPLRPAGTPFRLGVWEILRTIPYGATTTYGQIAAQLAAARGGRMSAQAVGGAVGSNPISILIPCHRVVGAGGQLVGYAGGVDKKVFLLSLETRGKARGEKSDSGESGSPLHDDGSRSGRNLSIGR